MPKEVAKRPLKILCVDDEPEILTQLATLITSHGYEPLTAPDASRALEVVRKEANRLALIISDFQMGERSGFDLRKDLLQEFRHIPFVMLSGYISREDALKAVELKIAAFVAKPYRDEELLKTIADESKDRVASIQEEDELLDGFVTDATGLVEEMEGLILSLEDNPSDVEAINRIFACAHTIKGASGFFKPDTVHRFTHRYEDYLAVFKRSPEKINPRSISVLLKGLDVIKGLIAALQAEAQDAPALESLTSIFEVNEPRGEESAGVPAGQLQRQGGPPQPQAQKTEELRVSVALLDDFMEKSGEITVLRNMLNKVLRALEASNPADSNVAMLSDLLSEMHKVVSSMQSQLEDLRKVPVKQVFKPLGRTLRDLCVGLKKQISLETEGDALRIDHTLAETLGKCLVHMLRNSADHGIESSEQRAALGKKAGGFIGVSCAETAEEIVVTMKDDGRGIDPVKVKSKAVEKGLISETDALKLPDAAARMLIFEPGFSTAEKVTDVSGRGVGTDMVKTTITSIGGRIQLDSAVGQGTTFTLFLPIPKSVMIINSLMIRASGHVFAVPQDKIVRVVRTEAHKGAGTLVSIGGALFFQDGQGLLPVVCLSRLLGIGDGMQPKEESVAMVLMQSKSGRYCLMVDDILDSEEIVVKKFGKWFNAINGYMGATFLGDGKIGLILDADGIGEKAKLRPRAAAGQPLESSAAGDGAVETSSLLLFGLDGKSTYAVKQGAIFRLEEIKTSRIRRFGQQLVTIYRDQTMPVLPVRWLLDERPNLDASELLAAESIPSIIVERSGRFFAFAVKSIGDFVERQAGAEEVSFDGRSKTCIVGDQTVTVLDLESLLTTGVSAGLAA